MKSRPEGPELHRLKTFVNYDPESFNRLYSELKPLIKYLASQVNTRNLNVSRDIICSYFEDKFLYVYNKYQAEYEYDKLKSTLIKSLKIFKNKLLTRAYSEEANFNLNTTRFEDLIYDQVSGEDNPEDGERENPIDLEDISEDSDDILDKALRYIKNTLTEDEYLIFTIEMNPPEFFKKRIKKSHGKLTAAHFIEFFELPANRKSKEVITRIRKHIKEVVKSARNHI